MVVVPQPHPDYYEVPMAFVTVAHGMQVSLKELFENIYTLAPLLTTLYLRSRKMISTEPWRKNYRTI